MNIRNLLITLSLAVVLSLVEAFGQSQLAKFYKQSVKKYYLPLITIICYLIITYILYLSYGYANMSTVEVIWNGVTTILLPIVGIIMFNTKINLYAWFGIILTAIGCTIVGINST